MNPLSSPPRLAVWVLLGGLWAPCGAALAQAPSASLPQAVPVSPRLAVVDPHSAVPRALPREAWRRWSALGLEPLPALDWRTANAQVLRAGGWRTYAREPLPSAEPASAPAAAAGATR